jgi:hypothetical protein
MNRLKSNLTRSICSKLLKADQIDLPITYNENENIKRNE